MKKLVCGVLAGVMVLSMGATAFAASEDADKNFTGNLGGRAGGNLEEKAAEAGLTIEEYIEQMGIEFGGKMSGGQGMKGLGGGNLEEKAAEAGLTVEEYLEQNGMGKNGNGEGEGIPGGNIEEKAAEMGLTVEEYQAQKQAEREAVIEEKAAEAGMTVEEYLEQMKENHPGAGRRSGSDE